MSARTPHLDLVLHVDRFLGGDDSLDRLQTVLVRHAPRWARKLHVYRSRSEPKTPLDPERPGVLREAVLARAREHGPLYEELRRHAPSPSTGTSTSGDAELRGSDAALTVVVVVDEQVLRPIAAKWKWGNRIALQIRRAKVDGTKSVAWAHEVFAELCEALSPVHAYAAPCAQYDAKNMSTEGGGLRAIGLDVANALPGLYWLNFFGRPYRDLLGRERLRGAPAAGTREVDDGVLLCVAEDARTWDTPIYREAEEAVLAHLGPEHFFSRDDPDRPGVAPDFGLPPVPPGKPFPFEVIVR